MSTVSQEELARLYKSISSGRASGILPKLRRMVDQYPLDRNLLHLAALAFWQSKDHKSSEELFKRTLEIDNNQHEAHNNLANLYKELGQNALAERHYRRAVSLVPSFFNAWKNLGLLLLQSQDYSESLLALIEAEKLSSNDASLMTAIGNAYRYKGMLSDAEQSYLRALQVDSCYVNALHNLGLTCYLKGEYKRAIGFYDRARDQAPEKSEIDANQASVYVAIDDYATAERLFLSALEKNPGNIEAHRYLNELYWQQCRYQDFGKSYDESLKKLPRSAAVYFSQIQMYISAQDYNRALECFEKVEKYCPHPQFDVLKARIFSERNELGKALDLYKTALLHSFSLEDAQEYTKILIRLGDMDLAQHQLNDCFRHDQNNQLSWALQSLIWRSIEDERYEWLYDFDRFIASYTIPTPNGYTKLEDFLSELESTVLGLHKSTQAPLMQTLKHGTQTPGRLFYRESAVIQTLRTAVSELILDYLANLNDDALHPLLRRKSKNFTYAGSWSVKLKPGGFHVNHVHPQGWISSSFYLSIPPSVSASTDTTHEGCIKFGESPFTLGDSDYARKVIRPEPGKLVLFPSYFWHGTIPFSGDDSQYRLTTPFDVVPMARY